MSSLGWNLLLLALCIAVSFLLSGLETGVMGLNRLRLRHLVREGDPAARRLQRYLQEPERFLLTILAGNALCNAAALLLVVFLLRRLSEAPWVWLGGLVAAAFGLFAFGDLLPKMLFRLNPTRTALWGARWFGLVRWMLTPAVAVATSLADLLLLVTGGRRFTGRVLTSREDLLHVIQEVGTALTADEKSMIDRVLRLQHTTVGGETAPMRAVQTLREDLTVGEALAIARRSEQDRYPVRDAETGRISGHVPIQELLYAGAEERDRPVGELQHPVVWLRETDLMETALQQFRRTGQRLAVVTDAANQEVGILSLEDILEHIFGRLEI
ncbi:MAG: DUF21 domain-containing protein [Verrucomicrobia bacterium]|nr:MAG: DUF21 domain-containing protein [Verrucomicrobiota bacterium]